MLAATFYAWRFSYFWLDDFNMFFWIQRLDRSLWQMLWDCINPFADAFRPFGMLFYWIFWHAFGLSSVPYHLFAWTLHSVNVLLVYILLSRIVGSAYGAAVGALLFGFRANFTDIYWSFGTIFELLALVLTLLALLVYRSEMKFHWRLTAIIVLYLLAVKSKEMAITLPAVLLLYDVCLRRVKFTRQLGALYAFLGLFGLGYGYARLASMGSAARTDPYYMDISAITLGRGYGWYFDRLYGVRLRWAVWIIAAAVLLAACAYMREKRILFFAGYIFITLLPVVFLINHRYEFFWYIPFCGFAGMVAVAVAAIENWLSSRMPARATAIVGLIAFVLLVSLHYWRERRASADVLLNEKSIASEYETFVVGLRNLPPPEPGATIYFRSLPRYFTRDVLLSATQVALSRTDVSVEVVDVR